MHSLLLFVTGVPNHPCSQDAYFGQVVLLESQAVAEYSQMRELTPFTNNLALPEPLQCGSAASLASYSYCNIH